MYLWIGVHRLCSGFIILPCLHGWNEGRVWCESFTPLDVQVAILWLMVCCLLFEENNALALILLANAGSSVRCSHFGTWDRSWYVSWKKATCCYETHCKCYRLGIFLTGHPISVLVSFRSLIEMMTTVPFLSSNFMEYGQLLYGKIQWDGVERVHVPDNRPCESLVPYFLRSWVLLLRIKSAMKIKTNLQMTG